MDCIMGVSRDAKRTNKQIDDIKMDEIFILSMGEKEYFLALLGIYSISFLL